MNKRILGTLLWFLVGWTAGSMLTYFAGLPAGLDITLATVLAAIVFVDPGHRLWPQGRRILKDIPAAEHPAGGRLAHE